MKYHPLAECLPRMSEQEFSDLVGSIERHGLREKITVFGGVIIDGISRYEACKKLKKSPLTREWEPDDPEASPEDIERQIRDFVIDKNLNRRQLSVGDRSMVAARLYEACPEITLETAAAKMGVSRRTAASAAKVLKAEPVLAEAVSKKEIPVSVAATLASLPAEEQAEALKEETEKRAAKKARPKKIKPEEPVDEVPQPVVPLTVVPPVVHDGFSSSEQKEWRQAFQVLIKMADKWIDLPPQLKTKVTSKAIHKKMIEHLRLFHAGWSARNPGGQWV